MKLKIENFYFKIIMLFPIATLFQANLEFVNKFLFAFLLILQVLLFNKKVHFKSFITIVITIIIFVYNYLITKNPLYNINELFYLPFALIFFNYMEFNLEKIVIFLKNNERYVNLILKVWTILVFVSIFLKSSWPAGWGSGMYFGSYCKSVFRLAPTALFIGSLAICCMNVFAEKKYFYYLILPLFCFLMGGSRTYLIVGILLFILGWYYFSKSKKMFIGTIVPVSLILLILVLNSSMMDKFAAVTYTNKSFFDFWGTVTSGRSIFWKADLDHFIESSIVSKLFGNGFNSIYEINFKAFGGLVWAHNDFIQILISHGFVLLLIYIRTICSFIRNNLKKNTNLFVLIMIFSIWIFNASFNMFYTYFCATLSLPFIVILAKYKNDYLIVEDKND